MLWPVAVSGELGLGSVDSVGLGRSKAATAIATKNNTKIFKK
jgi:hypothetical protein